MARRNDTEPLSDAIQDYLREVYKLETAGERATTSTVAAAMDVSAPSASVMLKRLAALDLVEHTPYRGVELTESGRRVALEIVRHHRLLEQYLAETLGVPVERVHAEADRLEHALSEELERLIDAKLGPHTRPARPPDPGRGTEARVDDGRALAPRARARGGRHHPSCSGRRQRAAALPLGARRAAGPLDRRRALRALRRSGHAPVGERRARDLARARGRDRRRVAPRASACPARRRRSRPRRSRPRRSRSRRPVGARPTRAARRPRPRRPSQRRRRSSSRACGRGAP